MAWRPPGRFRLAPSSRSRGQHRYYLYVAVTLYMLHVGYITFLHSVRARGISHLLRPVSVALHTPRRHAIEAADQEQHNSKS